MKKIKIANPYIDNEDKKAVLGVLKSGHLSLGPRYKEFEGKLAAYVGTKYACAVCNGTAGLHLAVRALDIHEGDEVITTPFSFVASANCLLFERAKPVFVDIEEQTFNLDPEKIAEAITKKTKAILVVHVFGQMAKMDKIMEIAQKYKLKVIEDACESLGATYKGKMAGTLGEMGVYSFYPNKQMTTGEGAIIVTKNKKIASLCESLRNQGRGETTGASWNWLTSVRLGYNYRLDEMSAALGITQLTKLKWMIEKRREIVGWYNKALQGIPGLLLPKVGPNRIHTWFLYVIRITGGRRNEVMEELIEKGIEVRPYFPVIHLQPYMQKITGSQKGDFPVAEKVASQTLALPLFIGLKKSDIYYIAEKLKEILS